MTRNKCKKEFSRKKLAINLLNLKHYPVKINHTFSKWPGKSLSSNYEIKTLTLHEKVEIHIHSIDSIESLNS